jgi:CheY-like chemotaxis protein
MNNNSPDETGNGANGVPPSHDISLLKKVVLLVDVNPDTRESRAKVLRTRGVTVHCASSARGARLRVHSAAYNLILVDLGSESEAAEALVQEIRLKNPRQLVAFLVGSPLFIAKSLRSKGVSRSRDTIRTTAPSGMSPAVASNDPFNFGQKIREAEGEKDVA